MDPVFFCLPLICKAASAASWQFAKAAIATANLENIKILKLQHRKHFCVNNMGYS